MRLYGVMTQAFVAAAIFVAATVLVETALSQTESNGAVAITSYGKYSLAPIEATEYKLTRTFRQAVSDRMSGKIIPLFWEWNDSNKVDAQFPELTVMLAIDRLKAVSGGGRMMWGALAGTPEVTAHVDLIEKPSGKLVGRRAFHLSKDPWSASAQAADFLLLDELVDQVMSYLKECYALGAATEADSTQSP